MVSETIHVSRKATLWQYSQIIKLRELDHRSRMIYQKAMGGGEKKEGKERRKGVRKEGGR